MFDDEWSKRAVAVHKKLSAAKITDVNLTFEDLSAFISFREIGRGHNTVGKECDIEVMEKMLLRQQ